MVRPASPFSLLSSSNKLHKHIQSEYDTQVLSVLQRTVLPHYAMRLIVTYNGRAIHVKQSLSQFPTYEHLLDCISLATGILYDALICMTKDGLQIDQHVLDQLLCQDQDADTEFFIFDRDLLTADTDSMVHMLAVSIHNTPMTEPPMVVMGAPTPPRLWDAFRSWSHELLQHMKTHYTESRSLYESIQLIHRSTLVALAHVRLHANNIKSAAEKLASIALKDFAWMEELLVRNEKDMAVLRRVPVHPQLFASMSASTATESTSPSDFRSTLSDLFNIDHVRSSAQSCKHTFERLRGAYTQVTQTEAQLTQDLHELAAEIEQTEIEPSNKTFQHMEKLQRDLKDACDAFLIENEKCGFRRPAEWVQIHHQAEALRGQEVAALSTLDCLIQDRNELMQWHMNLVQDISSLQSDFTELGELIADTDAALETCVRNEFKVLKQVHTMYGAYGATLVEAVRRSEFTQMYLTKAQRIAELMAKVSEKETLRRKRHMQAISDVFPHDAIGTESALPLFDITTRRQDATPTITRRDVAEFRAQLKALDSEAREAHLHPALEAAVLAYMAPLDLEPGDCNASFAALARRELGLEESSSYEAGDGDDEDDEEDDEASTEDRPT